MQQEQAITESQGLVSEELLGNLVRPSELRQVAEELRHSDGAA